MSINVYFYYNESFNDSTARKSIKGKSEKNMEENLKDS